jgi:hypothetical protein
LNYKNHIKNVEDIDLKLLIEDLKCYEYILEYLFTYEEIYTGFENQEDIIQDIIMENFGNLEQIESWKEDKRYYINNVYTYMDFIGMNEDINQVEIIENIKNNVNAVLFIFSHFDIIYENIKGKVNENTTLYNR